MADMPRYLALPFPNSPVIQDGVHVGFTVGVTLVQDSQSVTESVEVICGADEAAALLAGPIEAFTTWSHQAVVDHDLVAKANVAMDAALTVQSS